MRWRLPVLTALTVAVVTACGGPDRAADGRRADLEFTTVIGVSPDDRKRVAVALWRTAAVSRVVRADDSPHRYRVFLKDHSNLIVMAHVHGTLEAQPGVAGVSSLADYMGVSETP